MQFETKIMSSSMKLSIRYLKLKESECVIVWPKNHKKAETKPNFLLAKISLTVVE